MLLIMFACSLRRILLTKVQMHTAASARARCAQCSSTARSHRLCLRESRVNHKNAKNHTSAVRKTAATLFIARIACVRLTPSTKTQPHTSARTAQERATPVDLLQRWAKRVPGVSARHSNAKPHTSAPGHIHSLLAQSACTRQQRGLRVLLSQSQALLQYTCLECRRTQNTQNTTAERDSAYTYCTG